ncbi:MAG: hypothetical protein KUA35_05335 [Pseudodesulfovibrio sp.]|uniref:Arginine dihydrolase ArgZ/ArgE-like C-terminal second subdomain domain-containing protein n=1 Tax=Pseudodesulfovibrio aespoeensis (strain ATCC 700646 / DSM 10631 / Aspo-2) TaxID=643562 RepID=E6VR05_PSEA9|nr:MULTISPECIES: hypothetical protein [Pseudodesulfovibrio]MBU4380234.1 hypothetical protein [Pseudomonadota bacterium]MCG2731959.1 hypothetical protein [Pseudodesulfovibrio aespoeensis]ADU62985.1 hypothetical protein Daes_1976 [Pseudodesulfovibrio aespoeensis Aspo-2]MBU4475911.1 hypothetical protein [Pseudomonadota bacterium]MBU4516749.1 hypothetical protein [Pseudomonadota bacterium]
MTLKKFDTSRLRVLPLSQREHDLDLSVLADLRPTPAVHPSLARVGGKILRARELGASVILMMGAHVIRSGVQRYIIDLMERGYVTCLAGNGACAIHDFELALIGRTTESVAKYISEGQFGLWRETGLLNDIVADGVAQGWGVGESVGRAILDGEYPHKDISLFAAAHRLGIPFTVHVGIGSDIVHEHPNCDGAAWGAASYTDFLHYAAAVETVENGVVMNFGSAIMAPEVYLKALAMARNVAMQQGREICRLTTLVCDLRNLPEDVSAEPERGSADYYFRPWKTMLVRTVRDGGESYYVRAPHDESIPQLWTGLGKQE